MACPSQCGLSGARIIEMARMIFAPDSAGKRLFEYLAGEKTVEVEKKKKNGKEITVTKHKYKLPADRTKWLSWVDTDGDDLIEIDCSHMVHKALRTGSGLT